MVEKCIKIDKQNFLLNVFPCIITFKEEYNKCQFSLKELLLQSLYRNKIFGFNYLNFELIGNQ